MIPPAMVIIQQIGGNRRIGWHIQVEGSDFKAFTRAPLGNPQKYATLRL